MNRQDLDPNRVRILALLIPSAMIGLSQILDFGSTVLDKLFPDKDEREKAKIHLIELQQKGELEDLKTRLSAILAEANSQDKWTSRARPSFMYVIYLLILFSIPMGIVSAIHPGTALSIIKGMGEYLQSIPDGLWATFGIGYTGYAVARSYDKFKLIQSK